MVSCRTLKRYSGGRVEVIKRMINDQLKEKAKSKFSEVAVGRKFAARIGAYKELKAKYNAELEELRRGIAEGLQEYNADWDSYNPTSTKIFFSTHKCYVPDEVLDRLQEAATLFDLGKRKQAAGICDALIREYKLEG